MLNIDLKKGNSSIIKFGGYDDYLGLPEGPLMIFQAGRSDVTPSWKLVCDFTQIGK
jgi:hypothetical protein